jgi:DNA-binding NtrC family response regulator
MKNVCEVFDMSSLDRREAPRVLDVGQCNMDHRTISEHLARRFGANVDRAHGLADARQALGQARYALVLVNRQLDADGAPGVDVVRAIKADADPAVASTPVMLVSNFPDAQEAARAVGAEPGFGKAQLDSPETASRLEALLR